MLQKFLLIAIILCSITGSAQWQQTGSKVRYVNGLGIPTKDTAAGVAADSSQIVIRPQDSALYVKYKRTWLRVGGGGGSIAGSGTTNYIPKFTSSTAIGNSQIFDNGTNVGIGTASPTPYTAGARVFNQLSSNANSEIKLTNSTTGNNAGVGLLIAQYGVNSYLLNASAGFLVFGTSDAERMRITSAGDVGIGTASPAAALDVRPNSGIVVGSVGRAFIRQTLGGDAEMGCASGGYLSIFSDGSEKMRILSSGNVGIGTASPATDLQISRAGSSTFRLTNTSNTTNVELGIATALGFVGTNTDNSFAINTNNAERVRVTNTGNVGIGTASPANKLDVSGDIRATGQINVGVGSNFSGAFINESDVSKSLTISADPSNFGANSFMRFNVDNAERMRITSGGNALLGTTTDNGTDRLQVSGSASVTSLLGVGTSPSAGTVHIKTTSPSIAIDDNDNAGTAAIRFRPQSASFATRGSIELVSTGSAAPTRFVIASTDTMTFRTNSIERMRITSAGGNVLISKTTDNGIDKLQVNGSIDAKGFAQAYTAKGATYTAATSDYLIDCTSGTFTVNLPDALLNVGRILVIKNSGTGTITVDGFSTQTIDGATTYSLSAQWATVQIMCDGSNWKIISKF